MHEPEERHGAVCAEGTELWVARGTDEWGALQVLPSQRSNADYCTIFTIGRAVDSQHEVSAEEGWSAALVVMSYELRVMSYEL